MNKFARFVPASNAFRSLAVATGSVVGFTSNATAAVPAEVTAAVTGISADATGVATLVLLAIVAIFAIKFIRKGL